MTDSAQHPRLQIAYVIPGTGVSGGIAVVCQHANRLRARGHNVTLVTEGPAGGLDWFPDLRVPVVTIDDWTGSPDVLVATGWTTVFRVATMRAAHRFYFVQSDETRFHLAGSAWQHITRLSYSLRLNYLTEARWIQAWLKEAFQHDAALVPNGLDETIFFPDVPLEVRRRRPRVLLEGAIGLPYKGMDEAFRAVRDLDVDVWCVSSLGRPRRGWRCDRFFEHVPMTSMRSIYSSCDVLLKLSRVEGFFGPPMEMMACAGTVVVGRVTGHDEYIEDGVNALVVDPGRPDEAGDAVLRILSEPTLRASLTEAGLRTAREWRWEPSIDRLERLYMDVVAGRRGDVEPADGRPEAVSLDYFYRLLRGEMPSVRTGDSDDGAVRAAALLTAGAIAGMQADPTEKLIERLRYAPWFRAIARVTYGAYRRATRVRTRLRRWTGGIG